MINLQDLRKAVDVLKEGYIKSKDIYSILVPNEVIRVVKEDKAYYVFLGTDWNNQDDTKANIEFLNTKTLHSGYLHKAKQILMSYHFINSLNDDAMEYEIVFVGFSLGSAIAQILHLLLHPVIRISLKGENIKTTRGAIIFGKEILNVPKLNNLCTYGFGSPRVLSPTDQKLYKVVLEHDYKCYIVNHFLDGVRVLPTPVFSYLGKEYLLRGNILTRDNWITKVLRLLIANIWVAICMLKDTFEIHSVDKYKKGIYKLIKIKE